MIDRWLTTPHDELIPLMKHMFDYTIRTILFAVYDFNRDNPELVSSLHDSYKAVSFLKQMLICPSFSFKHITSITVYFNSNWGMI